MRRKSLEKELNSNIGLVQNLNEQLELEYSSQKMTSADNPMLKTKSDNYYDPENFRLNLDA